MRTVDERVAAVRSRSRRLQRRRDDLMLSAPLCLIALLFAGFAGGYAVYGGTTDPEPGAGLFGASFFFGPSAGGYVLVAVASFAVAVLVTALVMLRRRAKDEGAEHGEEDGGAHHGKTR